MLTLHQKISFLIVTAAVLLGVLPPATTHAQQQLLNVSYDPTRELYAEINKVFVKEWQKQSGQPITVDQSHGGSSKQARAVIDGLEADVVTLALPFDIDALHEKANLVPADWQARLPNKSSPYTSTIVFLVRKGNAKGIRDWDDLIKPGVAVITPHPKTSGGARYNYLAAWGFALRKFNNDEAQAADFLASLYKNVPVLDTGARGATTTFVNRRIGDVLLAWENEAIAAVQGRNRESFEIVYPSVTILAEPPVAIVDKNVDKHGTRAAAEAYVKFLFTEQAQSIAAKHGYRPRSTTAAAAAGVQFDPIETFEVDDLYPDGWKVAQATHFADGGVYDRIQAK